MVAALEHVRRLGARHAGADRQPAAERLGRGHHVGPHRQLLVGPERAGPAHPGLDLVEDQQRPGRVAGLARRDDHLVGDHVDAGLPLDRLEHHRRRLLADRSPERIDVVARDGAEAPAGRA